MLLVDGIPNQYLGDAVYARLENGMVGLTLDDHHNDVLIWLEPQVMDALIQFNKDAVLEVHRQMMLKERT